MFPDYESESRCWLLQTLRNMLSLATKYQFGLVGHLNFKSNIFSDKRHQKQKYVKFTSFACFPQYNG